MGAAQPVMDALLVAALSALHERVATAVNRGPVDAATQRAALLELATAVDARVRNAFAEVEALIEGGARSIAPLVPPTDRFFDQVYIYMCVCVCLP